jgi:hypothetical protein
MGEEHVVEEKRRRKIFLGTHGEERRSTLFLDHILFSHWIAAHSSTPPTSTMKSNSPPAACPKKGFQNSSYYAFTMKMATAMFAETLNNIQHSTRLTPESRSYTLNSSRENPRTRSTFVVLHSVV